MSYLHPLLTILLLLVAVGASGCRNTKTHKRPTCLFLASWRYSWSAGRRWLGLPLNLWSTGSHAWPFRPDDGQAIVVLSANVLPPVSERPIPLPDRDTYERCQYAAWLYKNWHRLPILAGGGRPAENREPYAATMRRILQSEGVDDWMIWTEERSRSTHDNATYGAEVLRGKGIHQVVLVTEAYHMLRSEKCFRKEGLCVIPAPCGLRTLEFELQEFLPGWKAIYHNECTLHDEVGWCGIRWI